MPQITLTKAYSETFASATTWVVKHRLGTIAPVVDCWSGGSPDLKMMPVSVVANSPSQVTITWSTPTAGRVYVV